MLAESGLCKATTATSSSTTSAGIACAGYGDGFSGITFGERGESRKDSAGRLVAHGACSIFSGLSYGAYYFEPAITLRAKIFVDRHITLSIANFSSLVAYKSSHRQVAFVWSVEGGADRWSGGLMCVPSL